MKGFLLSFLAAFLFGVMIITAMIRTPAFIELNNRQACFYRMHEEDASASGVVVAGVRP